MHANVSDRCQSEELRLFLLTRLLTYPRALLFASNRTQKLHAHDQVHSLSQVPRCSWSRGTNVRAFCKEAPIAWCWCRTAWRNMTTCAHQQLSHTRPASTCLTSVGCLKTSNLSVSVVPSRNLASHRKLQTKLQTYGSRIAATARMAPHSTSQQAPQQSKDLRGKGLSAAEGRQLLVDSIPLESFKMAGVSFEGRQDAVSKLRPGEEQCLMLTVTIHSCFCAQQTA